MSELLNGLAGRSGSFDGLSGLGDDWEDGLIISEQSDLPRKIGYILHLQKRG